MRKVKDAVDLTTNEKIYFKGHAKATYLSDGRNVEEAIAEIPTAESEVFEATYGETPYKDIVAAFNEKRHVFFNRYNYIYSLVRSHNETLHFSCISGENNLYVTCNSKNQWTSFTYPVETISNKTTSLSSASTDTQYPSAKAVYDFVNNTLGTIINGDY